MNISNVHSLSPGKKSIRNYILLSFFLVSILSGLIACLIFHNAIQNALLEKGIQPHVIEGIKGYLFATGTAIIITGVLLSLTAAFYIAAKITQPIKELTKGAIDIGRGRLERRIKFDGYDELTSLSEGFNYMAEHIETSLKEIRASKDYNDNIVVSVPSVLIVMNRQMEILSTNMAFEKISKQYPSLTLNAFTKKLADDISRNLETGETVHNEIAIVPPGSETSLIFTSTVSSLGHEEDSSDTGSARILLTLTDVTERRKMKELVLQSMQDWKDTFDMIPDMITIHDKEYNIVQANKAAREMLKLNSMDLSLNNKCYKHYHGKDQAPDECPSCNCLKTRMPVTFEIFEPHLNKFIEIRSIPRISSSNELIGLIHIGRDVSVRKKIEQEHSKLLHAVTKAKIEWEMTFDSAMEHIVIIDKDLLITRCNKSFSEFVNRSQDDIIGHYCFEFFPCSEQVTEECKYCMQNSKTLPVKSELRTPSGHWLYISHRRIMEEKGISSQSVIIATDITHIKRTQEELNASKETLKKKVADLESFYDMAVGRELKMKELKREIKSLKSGLVGYNANNNEPIDN